ncbi:MAG: hypothetical protein J7L96_02370 [Bacteroidales bacterium]|nr:hypothetical protein [Bacteroidales bacterium]
MTSKERIKLALAHKEPDRIPVDIDSCGVTGIHWIALKKYIEKYYGYSPKLSIWHIKEQLATVPDDVRKEWRIDTKRVYSSAPGYWNAKIMKENGYETFTDEWGIKWSKPLKGGLYFDMTEHPLRDIDTIEGLKSYKWPDPADPKRFEKLYRLNFDSPEYSNYGLVASSFMSGMFETALWIRGFENFFIDLSLNPRFAEYILDKMLEMEIAYWDKMLEITGEKVDIILYSDDVATQKGLMISPSMYKRFLFPRRKRLYEFIKSKANVKILYHSCGAVMKLVPFFLEEGIDILNPLQISATGMDLVQLKKEFGDHLAFWGGGVDTQRILPYGTPKEVEEHVKRQIDILAPGGGFVFSTVHCIQPDVPPENIRAMFDAIEKYGDY